jgi:hypothetical protein
VPYTSLAANRTYTETRKPMMTESKKGGCQCGHVRYEIIEEPVGLAVCHCRECQRQSGSAFGMSLAVPDRSFRLRSGALKSFEVKCDSGRIKTCAFCPECGTRIYHQTVSGMSVKAGTLDDTFGLEPDAHYWTKRKQRWIVIPSDVAQIVDDG